MRSSALWRNSPMGRYALLLFATGLVTVGCGDPSSRDQDGDGYSSDRDCDESNANIFPGAQERCNGVDDDCDGLLDEEPVDGNVYYSDEDGDGFYGAPIVACELPSGHGLASNDCNDANAAINPGAEELCDGVDNDCSGSIGDEESDTDQDGYLACEECDDTDAVVSPAATEICDSIDNDCDGVVDEDGAFTPDNDGDGYGDESAPSVTASCSSPPDGFAPNATDCDDENPLINPSQPEVCDDSDLDEDCSGASDDDDPNVASGQSAWFVDSDGDGYGGTTPLMLCDQPANSVDDHTDCDDSTPLANPGIPDETCGDGIDNNCDGGAIGCGIYGDVGLGSEAIEIAGEAADDRAGMTVAGGGDVNGDGFSDLLVGAPRQAAGGSNAGAVYILDGPLSSTVDLGSAGAKLVGESGGDRAGSALANGGDVNGDGFDDVLIGAAEYDVGRGAVYLLLGPLAGEIDLASADAKFLGTGEQDHFGAALAGGRDLNGDGFHDIVIGAPGASAFDPGEGAVYVFFGPVLGELEAEDADVVYRGESQADSAGGAVAITSDVDGDGQDEILIGADGSGDAGAAYVVALPASASGEFNLSAATTKVVGEDSGDVAGRAVADAGDVNGDGFGDYLVGAPWHAAGGNRAGAAYLILGPPPGFLDLANADAKFVGENPDDAVGISISGGGDTDGDGFSDLLLGAFENDSNGGDSAGAAYLIHGPVTGTVDLSSSDAKLHGANLGDKAGWSVAWAGDTNSDGLDDLVVGASFADPGGPSSGAAYLFLGLPGL